MDAQKGDELHFTQSMEMADFYSRDLDRTFDLVLFVDNISTLPIPAATPALGSMQQPQQEAMAHERSSKNWTKKKSRWKPKMVQYNWPNFFWKTLRNTTENVLKLPAKSPDSIPGLWEKNWAHIQDGSSYGKHFDLTVTTQDIIPVGDVVIFEGTLVLNKDLGSGYFYEFLLEDATAKRAEVSEKV